MILFKTKQHPPSRMFPFRAAHACPTLLGLRVLPCQTQHGSVRFLKPLLNFLFFPFVICIWVVLFPWNPVTSPKVVAEHDLKPHWPGKFPSKRGFFPLLELYTSLSNCAGNPSAYCSIDNRLALNVPLHSLRAWAGKDLATLAAGIFTATDPATVLQVVSAFLKDLHCWFSFLCPLSAGLTFKISPKFRGFSEY